MNRLLAIVPLLLLSMPSAAQIPGESWLTGENAIFLKQLVTQTSTLTEVKNLVSGIRDVSGTLNEGLSIARQTYKQAIAIRDFSMSEFVGQAEAALMQAFPEAETIIGDVKDLRNQFQLIEQGGTGFFEYQGRRDGQMSKLMQTYFSLGYQNVISTNLFRDPEQSKSLGIQPTMAELAVFRRYKETGNLAKALLEKTAFASLSGKAAAIEKEVLEKEDPKIDEIIAAAELRSSLRREEKLTEMLELIKIQLAEEMMERGKEKDTRSMMLKSIQKGIKKEIPLVPLEEED